jgi:hypothetical protein
MAQTKISGTVQCSKPDEQHALEVGDRPNHSLMIAKGKCLEIAGTQAKEDVGTGFDEIAGNRSHGHGYVINTWANGDKSYVHTQGSATLKDGAIESAEGTWNFTGGTGKLKGIKGKGTYKGKGAPGGSVTFTCGMPSGGFNPTRRYTHLRGTFSSVTTCPTVRS